MPEDEFGTPELWDEYQWERFLQEQDQKTEQYFALFEKYSDHPERDEIIAREMGWNSDHDDSEEPPFEIWADTDAEFTEDSDDDCENASAEEDEECDEETAFGELQNSEVYLLSMELNRRVYTIIEQNESLHNHPVAVELATRATICSAKMAAALCGDEYSEVGMTIAYLKRSLKAANDCLSAAHQLRDSSQLSDDDAAQFTGVLFPIRERLVDMMAEYRVELRRRRGEG